jgi:hypothetical protein
MMPITLETTDNQALLKEAIRALAVDRPILRIETINNGAGLKLHLYGGEVLTYEPIQAPLQPKRKRRLNDRRGAV